MDIFKDIQPLSEFKKNASMLDAEIYPNVLNERELAESVDVLKQRIANLRDGGNPIPADEVFAKISKKYGITFD